MSEMRDIVEQLWNRDGQNWSRCKEKPDQRDTLYAKAALAIGEASRSVALARAEITSLRQRAEAAEKRVAELEAAHAWQPIETAPHDGRLHLVFLPYFGVCMSRRIGPESPDFEGCPTEHPTHWMPMPASPEPPDATAGALAKGGAK